MYQQQINKIAVICSQYGIEDVVVSPGSRSAPLSLAFARYARFSLRTVVDERSAAFIALGIAQQKRKPVVLICTSGTAVLNYFPAVAEAFFQKLPLLLLTADRPPELIGQQDGQTIFQEQVFGRHVKASYQLPDRYEDEAAGSELEQTMNEALQRISLHDLGPVHVNVPLREPLYESAPFTYDEQVLHSSHPEQHEAFSIDPSLLSIWKHSPAKLMVAGALPPDAALESLLDKFTGAHKIPLLADLSSNLRGISTLNAYDYLLQMADEKIQETLRPDLLISIGEMHVSKSLKQFLRKQRPRYHFHINTSVPVADTFQSITHVLPTDAKTFFRVFAGALPAIDTEQSYLSQWLWNETLATQQYRRLFEKAGFSEFSALFELWPHLPAQGIVQLGNSMAVRYASYLGHQPGLRFFSNRGTSGIDGSVSTAVGAALCTDQLCTLICGDLSFLYDIHAFWNDFVPPNLRVIVLNNSGGGIFRLLEGPAAQPELESLFETRQQENRIGPLATLYGLEHRQVSNFKELKAALPAFFAPREKASVLEIKSDPAQNQQFFKAFKALRIS